MPKKLVWVATLFFVTLFVRFADGQTPNPCETKIAIEIKEDRNENLRSTIAAMEKAFDCNDALSIADMFAPKAIESVGGREKFISWLNSAWRSYSAASWKFGDPKDLLLLNGDWFSIVPARLEGVAKKRHRLAETCFVGVSSDDGRSWTFVTGESFFELYPELAGRIQIIERKETESFDSQ